MCIRDRVPAVHEAVDRAGGENVRMVGGKVDVRDRSRMSMQDVLDRRLRATRFEVPYQRSLVRCAHDPVVSTCEGRPLYIRWNPRCLMAQAPRRRVWRVEIDDVKSLLPVIVNLVVPEDSGDTHDAKTTSLPLGEIDADPTASFTLIRMSCANVGLSNIVDVSTLFCWVMNAILAQASVALSQRRCEATARDSALLSGACLTLIQHRCESKKLTCVMSRVGSSRTRAKRDATVQVLAKTRTWMASPHVMRSRGLTFHLYACIHHKHPRPSQSHTL